jgi:hypothetical protein
MTPWTPADVPNDILNPIDVQNDILNPADVPNGILNPADVLNDILNPADVLNDSLKPKWCIQWLLEPQLMYSMTSLTQLTYSNSLNPSWCTEWPPCVQPLSCSLTRALSPGWSWASSRPGSPGARSEPNRRGEPRHPPPPASLMQANQLRNRISLRALIFKLLRRSRVDSKDSIPPAYVAWRAGTTTHFLLGSLPT